MYIASAHGEGVQAARVRHTPHVCTPSWVTEFSGKAPRREMCGFAGRGEATPIWSLRALQTSSLHPRSHRGQRAALPGMRISLLIRSSDQGSG